MRAASSTGVEVTEQVHDHIRKNKSNKYNDTGYAMSIKQGKRQSNTALKYNLHIALQSH